MRRIEFVAPANMENLAELRGWTLGAPPVDGEVEVVINLRPWQRVTPNPLVGLVAIAARYARHSKQIAIHYPNADYARRMLHTVGFTEALRTFAPWTDDEPSPGKVERILPVIPVQNFRTHDDVERLVEVMEEQFSASDRLPASLLQDASTALGEAADNVIWHADCAEGGFALAQVRRRRVFGVTRRFIEIAVADPGRGIRASLGGEGDDLDAVNRALTEGVTGSGEPYRGYGLAHMEDAARQPQRLLTVHSGEGFAARGYRYDLSQQVEARFPGTLITMSMLAS